MKMILTCIKKLIKPFVLSIYWFVVSIVQNRSISSWKVSVHSKLGHFVVVRKGVEIGPDVELGDYSYVSGPRAYIESARIGKFCSIARQTVIGVGNHNHQAVSTHPFFFSKEFGGIAKFNKHQSQKPPPVIGNDVWIGINSIIMRGVSIGDGAVIAANSVVTKDVAPYTIVGGIPAKYIRDRFTPDVTEKLKSIRWWDWDRSLLCERAKDFYNTENFVNKFSDTQ